MQADRTHVGKNDGQSRSILQPLHSHKKRERINRHQSSVLCLLPSVLRPLLCATRHASRLNRPLVGLILCYVALSLFSLLLIPVRQIFRDFRFFGFPDFFFYMSIGQPYSIYYPIPAMTRLILYVVLAVQLASLNLRTDACKSIFLGLFSGGIFCSFIGLLDSIKAVSPRWPQWQWRLQ